MVRTGLQRDVGRRAAGTFAGLGQGVDLGVGLAAAAVPSGLKTGCFWMPASAMPAPRRRA